MEEPIADGGPAGEIADSIQNKGACTGLDEALIGALTTPLNVAPVMALTVSVLAKAMPLLMVRTGRMLPPALNVIVGLVTPSLINWSWLPWMV